jgi:multicomponent Na+:H+ antiporter subunit F
MIFIDICLGVLVFAFVMGLVRAAIGPSLADRAVGTDQCLFTVVATLGLLSVRFETAVFMDAPLVASLLGFLATISLAWLLHRKGYIPLGGLGGISREEEEELR